MKFPFLQQLKKNRHLTLRLLWDLFMVWVALINLGLILFDLTYLLLRPTYFRFIPALTEIYDQVKGIEEHPLTHELSRTIADANRLIELDPDSEELDRLVDNLVDLTVRVLLENPFERSGQARYTEVMRVVIARELGTVSTALNRPGAIQDFVEQFWSREPSQLRRRLATAEVSLVPLFEVNYFREFDLAGRLVDHFWVIDLPFLALFWIEFIIRWLIAIRRRAHARWFFFPILNWYDVLGLIPSRSFRIFRLLRVISMYMRLRRSDLSRVGKDVFSRTVAYISNIITEEVSDMVTLRILNEYQGGIRNGTHLRIIEATMGSRRQEIESIVADQIVDILNDKEAQDGFRRLLHLNLDNAVDQAEALRSVPLPSPIVRPVVRAIGQVILDTTIESVSTTLDSQEGQQAIDDIVRSITDKILAGPGLEEVESLTKEITVDVIEHMKDAVSVRKWALPEENQEE